MKCPGQDMRYWKPGDIFDVSCPHCGKRIRIVPVRWNIPGIGSG